MDHARIDIPTHLLWQLREAASLPQSQRSYAAWSSVMPAIGASVVAWIGWRVAFAPTCLNKKPIGPPLVAVEWKPVFIVASSLLVLAIVRICYRMATRRWARLMPNASAFEKDIAYGEAEVTTLAIGDRHHMLDTDEGLALLMLPAAETATALVVLHTDEIDGAAGFNLKSSLRLITTLHTRSVIHSEFSGEPVPVRVGQGFHGSRLDVYLRDELAWAELGAVVAMPFETVVAMAAQRAPARPSLAALWLEALMPAAAPPREAPAGR